MEKKQDNHLDKNFEEIDRSYEEFSEGKKLPVEAFKENKEIFSEYIRTHKNEFSNLAEQTWKMLSRSKFASKMNSRTVEIMKGIRHCAKTYKGEKENSAFSKYIYKYLEDYVFSKKAEDFTSSFTITEAEKKRIKDVKSYIDSYQMVHHTTTVSDRLIEWISAQTGYKKEIVEEIVAHITRSVVSLDAPVGEEQDSSIDVESNERTQEELYIQNEKISFYMKKLEELWMGKKEDMKIKVSKLVTWKLLTELKIKDYESFGDLLFNYKVIDTKLVKDFYAGVYRDDFTQKRIAKELGLTNDYANKILNERTLSVLENSEAEFEQLFDENL